MHYLLCTRKSDVALLVRELEGVADQVTSFPGLPLVAVPDTVNLADRYLGFASQALPGARPVAAGTISQQAEATLALSGDQRRHGGELTLHVFSMTGKYGIYTEGRAALLRRAVAKQLHRHGMSPARRGPWHGKPFLQILIFPDRALAVSCLTAEEAMRHAHLLSPFPGGFVMVAEDKAAPSRAYRKLIEAQAVLGRRIAPGECVVDLGAAPGGWTWVARQQGARVIAVDRAPLRDDLMADPEVTFHKGDAFKFVKDDGADWVISDIISTPERVWELVVRWVIGGLCDHFVFTLKFKGDADFAFLAGFKEKLHTLAYRCVLRRLNANKNEMTLMGTRHS